ncbi:MAG: hypothetical protein ACRCYO_02690, partial [Bacteroidia bacterium]
VKIVQQMLYNANYELSVTGTWDDKTKTALNEFSTSKLNTSSDIVKPKTKLARLLNSYRYITRTVIESSDPKETETQPTNTDTK